MKNRFELQDLKKELIKNNIDFTDESIKTQIDYLCDYGLLNKLGFDFEVYNNIRR